MVFALLCLSVLGSACRGEPAIVTTPSPSPSPAPQARITDANEAFRRTVAGLLDDVAETAEVEARTDRFAAASGGGGATLVAAAPIDGVEGLSTNDLSAGADLLLTFLPSTLDPQLVPGAYVVRVQRGARARTWRAVLVDLDGETAGEASATVEVRTATPSPSPDGSPVASPDAVAEGCRVFLERSDRRVGAGVECAAYTFSFSVGEDLTTPAAVSPEDLAGRMASANEELREVVGSALCDEAREWDISDCPAAFMIGSRDDSLIVSGSLAPDDPVPSNTRREGFDSMFNFMALPSEAGVPGGFGVVHIAQDEDGSWLSQLRSRNGRVVFEPITTVEEGPPRAAASPAPSPGEDGEERYVSYLDQSIVCTDHEYEEVDVSTGQSITVVEIQCYGRAASPTPTPEPAVRRTPRPTPRPTLSPTPSPSPEPTESPETPEPSPTESPGAS